MHLTLSVDHRCVDGVVAAQWMTSFVHVVENPLRIFLPISVASLLLGTLYGLWNVTVHSRIPNGSVLLILFAVVVFLVGLISEQISALRLESPSKQ